jgi:CRP-like cAMP-binding protein
MSQTRQPAVRNQLLAALASALQPIDLDFKQVLHRPDRPIEAAYFVESGMVPMLAPLEEGHTVSG